MDIELLEKVLAFFEIHQSGDLAEISQFCNINQMQARVALAELTNQEDAIITLRNGCYGSKRPKKVIVMPKKRYPLAPRIINALEEQSVQAHKELATRFETTIVNIQETIDFMKQKGSPFSRKISIDKMYTWLQEWREQEIIFAWVRKYQQQYPELNLVFSMPIGEKRPKVQNKNGQWYCPTGQRLKMQGAKDGLPDIWCCHARHGYHGIGIELKPMRGNQPSLEQETVLRQLKEAGWFACVRYGHKQVIDTLKKYLEIST